VISVDAALVPLPGRERRRAGVDLLITTIIAGPDGLPMHSAVSIPISQDAITHASRYRCGDRIQSAQALMEKRLPHRDQSQLCCPHEDWAIATIADSVPLWERTA